MDADDVIESYVTEVAARLPRKQRGDVAYELHALLDEELQGKADAAGREADADMATELVRAFGRPAEVAARYRPPLTIIDPADGRAFLRATAVGLVIIWSLGLVQALLPPIHSGWDLLTPLGAWWTTTVIPSLWWPGLLVVGFGTSSWSRRRWPQGSEWKPRAGNRVPTSRVAMALGLVGTLAGLFVLINPRWVLDFFWGGRAAQAAYDALTYTETFRERQAPYLLAVILLNVPTIITVIVNDRWTATMRRSRDWLGVVTSLVMLWTVFDGPIMVAPDADRTVKQAMVIIVGVTVIRLGINWYRGIRPAPERRIKA